MVEKPRQILWDVQAIEDFQEAILFIGKQSAKNAETVKLKIFAAVKELSKHPEGNL